MKHTPTGLLLAAAIPVCTAAEADMMGSFNCAYRDAAGLSDAAGKERGSN